MVLLVSGGLDPSQEAVRLVLAAPIPLCGRVYAVVEGIEQQGQHAERADHQQRLGGAGLFQKRVKPPSVYEKPEESS